MSLVTLFAPLSTMISTPAVVFICQRVFASVTKHDCTCACTREMVLPRCPLAEVGFRASSWQVYGMFVSGRKRVELLVEGLVEGSLFLWERGEKGKGREGEAERNKREKRGPVEQELKKKTKRWRTPQNSELAPHLVTCDRLGLRAKWMPSRTSFSYFLILTLTPFPYIFTYTSCLTTKAQATVRERHTRLTHRKNKAH